MEIAAPMEVSPITRKLLIDEIQLSGIVFHGALTEIDFLERLYPLDELPSEDPRFKTMRQDIGMHREQFPGDWPDNWVWSDDRLQLREGPSEVFLRFLAEMLHPLVRSKPSEIEKVLAVVNNQLATDGLEIGPVGKIQNRTLYGARFLGTGGRLVERAQTFVTLGVHVAQQVERLRKHGDDPMAAIGAAKELAESVCKTVLRARGLSYSREDPLPQLAKRMLDSLELVPPAFSASDQAAATVRRLLSSLVNIPHGLAELRNLSGSGHGREATFESLGPAYARLAADSAATFAAFIVESSGLVSQPAVLPSGTEG